VLPTTTLALRTPDGLKKAMDKAGRSTRWLASAADCSPARIAQLATGQFPATAASTAVAIAAALEVDVVDLFEFPDGETLVRLGLIRSA